MSGDCNICGGEHAECECPSATPGSKTARTHGCVCSAIYNHYGGGAYFDEDGVPQFWVSSNCPLHGEHGYNTIEVLDVKD